MTTAQVYLYNLGFVMTQAGYYETPLNKEVFAICDDGTNVTYYANGADDDGNLVALGTSVVGDNNTGFGFTNGLKAS